MKLKNIKINQKLLIEFISVTFAVFLGLMLNQWKDNQNNQKLASQSITNIRAEIDTNSARVKAMIDSHKMMVSRLDSVNSLSTEKYEQDNFSLSLDFKIISSTSWETAKLTQAITYMDYDVVSEIANLYHYQNYYESFVKEYVNKNIYVKSNVSYKEYVENMQRFLNAIIPIEKRLMDYYKQILNELPGGIKDE